MQIRWTRKALLNLDAAIKYISKENAVAAKDVAEKIWASSQMLANQPGIGRPGRLPGTRELIISGLPYILPYTELNGTVFILRVIHTSMTWPTDL